MKNEMIKRLGKEYTEAIERECEAENMSLFDFFLNFAQEYGGDHFYNLLDDLLIKYDIEVEYEDDELI